MPIPKPTGSETEDEFMGRCMKDPQMQSEYDKGQRTAVCLSSYRGKETEKQMTEVLDQNNQEIFVLVEDTVYNKMNYEIEKYANITWDKSKAHLLQ